MALELIINEDKIRQVPMDKWPEKVNEIKGTIASMVCSAGSGHIGGSFSAANILWAYSIFNRFGENFHLSKGHAVPALYALAYHYGNLDEKQLMRFRRKDGLSGHADHLVQLNPSGLLGMGGGTINGYKIGDNVNQKEGRIYSLFGDGETDEPIFFSSIRQAFELDLDVCYIIDYNNRNLTGPLVYNFEYFVEAIEAIAGEIMTVNNDVFDLYHKFEEISENPGPHFLVVGGKKGQGVKFIEDEKSGWHGKPISIGELSDACVELGVDPATYRDKTYVVVIDEGYEKAVQALEDRFGNEKKATRKANETLSEIDDKSLFVIIPDIGGSVCVDSFKKKYPERFLDVGINEELAASNALGLALRGFKPVVSTFDGFDYNLFNVAHHADYANPQFLAFNMTHSEFIGEDGPTHCITNNLGAWFGLQNLKVISNSPCYNQAVQAIRTAIEEPEKLGIEGNFMVYHRLFRPATNILYSPDNLPAPGKADMIRQGDGPVIISTGQEVWESLVAAEMLSKDGINSAVINVGYLKPLDTATIFPNIINKDVYVIEAHNPDVGLGSLLSRKILGNNIPIHSYFTKGIKGPVKSDSIAEQKKMFGLDGASLYKTIKNSR